MRIDLHTHSTCSDGTLSPAGLVEAAAAARLDVVALTDHDTFAGWAEAAAAATRLGVQLVPGVELSCRWYAADPPIALHLLGYYPAADHPGLTTELARVRLAREDRLAAILELIRADGIDIDIEEIRRYAGDATLGRPHIAAALVRHGLVDSVQAAFASEMLGRRWRLPKDDTDVFTALSLVRAAGGVPVFAHPRATRRGRTVPDELVAAMAEAGLAGLEADHEDHTPRQRAEVRALAGELGLLVTGSSDFHGSNKSVRLGAHLTAPEAFEAIRSAALAARSGRPSG
jgi:3',5'-nucleoside bisphosphate phosphatase